jgi:DNA-binding NarL/FixJ family response regulator
MTILYFDNDFNNADILRRALNASDDTLVLIAAATIQDVAHHLSERCPDIVLMDYRVSPTEGFEILRQLREFKCFNHTRVIMYSGFMDTSEIDECKLAGAYDQIGNTEDFRRLVKELQIILKGRH